MRSPAHLSGPLAVAALCALLLIGLLGGSGAAALASAALSSPPAVTATPSPSTSIPISIPTASPSATPPPVGRNSSPPPPLTARAAYLLDPTSGSIYLTLNAQTPLAMASTTKIMTALVALTFGSLDQPITIGADATALQNSGASVANLRQNDTLTLHQLLYALLLPSGDDAAIAIADGVAGSQDRFIALMNSQATLLGLWTTHYNDVHGLDAPNHYTTASDLAHLASVAMANPTFAAIVSAPTYTLDATTTHTAYTWTTTNKLLTTQRYPGVTGVKTGFTGDAGDCLVFSATRGPRTLIGVVLGEPDEQARFTDATHLLDWAFAQP